MRPNPVIHHTENNHTPRHQRTKVHSRRRRRCSRRPKAKEEYNDHIHTRPSICYDTKHPSKAERTPCEIAGSGVCFCLCPWQREFDGSGAAAPKQKGAAYKVGRVEAVDGKGEDIVKGGGGANVDETEEAGYDCGGEDGDEWY